MFFFWILFLSILRLSASQGQTNITAEPGQTVSLPCRAEGDGEITAVKWDRSGLGSDYVFLFRNNGHDAEAQHPSYKNRVNLQDRQMKDGNVSLVLKNLTTDDEGTYECRVTQTGGTEYTATVILKVGWNITVTAGQNVTLPGPVPSNYKRPYRAVEWSRGKGQEPDHVFVFINGTSDPVFKPPSYQKRVDLQDGDVSLVLKDVTTNDAGIYGCRVRQGGGHRRKRDVDPFISIVYLEVSLPPPPRMTQPGLAVGLTVGLIIVMVAAAAAAAAVGGVWIYKKKKISAPPPQSDSGENVPISSSADPTDQQPDV